MKQWLLILSTADVAPEVIKVDVTPSARRVVNQLDLGFFADKLTDIPGHVNHRLVAATGSVSDSLEDGKK